MQSVYKEKTKDGLGNNADDNYNKKTKIKEENEERRRIRRWKRKKEEDKIVSYN